MATADQMKMLIKSHFSGDQEQFKAAALQIAATEARQGHTTLARELKAIIDKYEKNRNKVIHLKNNEMLLHNDVDFRISDFVASDAITVRIVRIIEEYINRDKLKKYGLDNRRKILIEGPSGTGKTMTASIIASELNLPLFTVQMDKLMTKFMGETSIKLRQIFDTINELSGVYLFDEFDAIGADRSMDNEVGEIRRVLNSFLLFIEQDTSESIIIAATNNQRILDQALFRRFDDVLHYQMPTKAERVKLITSRLSLFGINYKVSDNVINYTEKLSHAEISQACEDAIKKSILYETEIDDGLLIAALQDRGSIYNSRGN